MPTLRLVPAPTTLATPKNASARDVRLALELRKLAELEPHVATRRFANQLADALLIRAVIPAPFEPPTHVRRRP